MSPSATSQEWLLRAEQKQQTIKKHISGWQQVEQVQRDGHLQCQGEIGHWDIL